MRHSVFREISKYVGLALVAVLLAAPAQSQVRRDTPPVLKKPAPPPLPDQREAIRAFAQENKRVKRPRFVLFWNRDFSDEVVTYYIDFLTQRSSASCTAAGLLAGCVAVSSDNGSSAANRRVADRQTLRMNQDEARKNLGEILNWKLEGSFKNTFIRGGARLIDREMIIRTLGANVQTNAKVNTYGLETQAMIGKADYMVEILLAPSFDSDSGLAFQVNVVGIETGETIASVYTDAMPPVRERVEYEATNRGFEERRVLDGLTDENVGRQLAINTMRELTGYWQIMVE